MMPMNVAIPTRIVATTTCSLSHPWNIVPREACPAVDDVEGHLQKSGGERWW